MFKSVELVAKGLPRREEEKKSRYLAGLKQRQRLAALACREEKKRRREKITLVGWFETKAEFGLSRRGREGRKKAVDRPR